MNLSKLITDQLKATLWADQIMLEAIPDEFLDMEIRSSFPSIRKTYNHMLDANTAWYYRMTGNTASPGDVSKNFAGSVADWKRLYLTSVQNFIDLLSDKDDAYFSGNLDYKSFKGELWSQPVFEILLHVANHASGHRGQIITMLRNAGYTGTLPGVDFIQWYRSINK